MRAAMRGHAGHAYSSEAKKGYARQSRASEKGNLRRGALNTSA